MQVALNFEDQISAYSRIALMSRFSLLSTVRMRDSSWRDDSQPAIPFSCAFFSILRFCCPIIKRFERLGYALQNWGIFTKERGFSLYIPQVTTSENKDLDIFLVGTPFSVLLYNTTALQTFETVQFMASVFELSKNKWGLTFCHKFYFSHAFSHCISYIGSVTEDAFW